MNRSLIVRFFTLVGTALAVAGILCADITGTISGVVTDPAGAVVAGAQLTLRNADTGLKREVKRLPQHLRKSLIEHFQTAPP